jgi:UDP-hydrolysing UDP-N-acetyl-D-glucosamine 2-epimerase
MRERKIAYVTGTRADYGLMSPVLQEIKKSDELELALFVTGMHLMQEFGETVNDVSNDFPDVKKINATIEGDDRSAVLEYGSKLAKELNERFREDKPDVTLTLGDRMEMLQVAIASVYLGIATGHIHGGERTHTVDEVVRHAITKLSHLHFPATKESSERIKKMGEDDWRINVVGAPALDVILSKKLPDRKELFESLDLNPNEVVALVLQHPVTEQEGVAAEQMKTTLEAVSSFDMQTVVIYPNADAGGRSMINEIDKYKDKSNFRIVKNLPQREFLALEREAVVWVGNSSAAMIESPSFATPVINVGDRQEGRERGENVIDVGYNKAQIIAAMEKSLNDEEYKEMIKNTDNPWGEGNASKKIVEVLKNVKLGSKLMVKQISY